MAYSPEMDVQYGEGEGTCIIGIILLWLLLVLYVFIMAHNPNNDTIEKQKVSDQKIQIEKTKKVLEKMWIVKYLKES